MSRTNGLLTIGKVAEAVGVAASTLRYYEREGLIQPRRRSDAGYRLYDTDAVQRLQFVRAAQAVGFTLNDIRVLLDLDAGDARTCQEEVQPLIERRMAEIDMKMKDLKRVRAALGRALDRCRGSNGQCVVLKELTGSKGRKARRSIQ